MSTKSIGTKASSLSVKERRIAATLYNWESLVQKYFHETVEVQTVMFFLFLATREEAVDMTSVASSLGLTKASASRNYYRLSEGLRGTEGLGLVESIGDPMDFRRKLLQLTPKGIEVAQELSGYILTSAERILNNAKGE